MCVCVASGPDRRPATCGRTALQRSFQVISGGLEESIFSIAVQTFHTLTELCQGPCPENQAALVARNVTSDINEVLESAFPHRSGGGVSGDCSSRSTAWSQHPCAAVLRARGAGGRGFNCPLQLLR